MKVVRLKKGYRITLSDADFGMLVNLVTDGVSASEGLEEYQYHEDWSPAEKAAFTRRTAKHGEFSILQADEDRR